MFDITETPLFKRLHSQIQQDNTVEVFTSLCEIGVVPEIEDNVATIVIDGESYSHSLSEIKETLDETRYRELFPEPNEPNEVIEPGSDIQGDIREIKAALKELKDFLTCKQGEIQVEKPDADKLTKLAYTDLKTHCLNTNALNRDFGALKKDEEYLFGQIDIRALKKINEQFGMDAGDNAIIYASKVIHEAFPESRIYIVYGDNFIIIEQASKMAQSAFVNAIFSVRDTCAQNGLNLAVTYTSSAGRGPMEIKKDLEQQINRARTVDPITTINWKVNKPVEKKEEPLFTSETLSED